jgi:hypothetical protein
MPSQTLLSVKHRAVAEGSEELSRTSRAAVGSAAAPIQGMPVKADASTCTPTIE